MPDALPVWGVGAVAPGEVVAERTSDAGERAVVMLVDGGAALAATHPDAACAVADADAREWHSVAVGKPWRP